MLIIFVMFQYLLIFIQKQYQSILSSILFLFTESVKSDSSAFIVTIKWTIFTVYGESVGCSRREDRKRQFHPEIVSDPGRLSLGVITRISSRALLSHITLSTFIFLLFFSHFLSLNGPKYFSHFH